MQYHRAAGAVSFTLFQPNKSVSWQAEMDLPPSQCVPVTRFEKNCHFLSPSSFVALPHLIPLSLYSSSSSISSTPGPSFSSSSIDVKSKQKLYNCSSTPVLVYVAARHASHGFFATLNVGKGALHRSIPPTKTFVPPISSSADFWEQNSQQASSHSCPEFP